MKYRPLPVVCIQGMNDRNIRAKSASVGSQPFGAELGLSGEIKRKHRQAQGQ
jgi:hypothetical protein